MPSRLESQTWRGRHAGGTLPRVTHPMAPEAARASLRMDWGRRDVVRGWAIVMAGIVFYLYAMLGSAAGPRDSLFASGIVGWIAISALLLGAALWAAGAIVYLCEGERTRPDERA
jgi:hypothetical protein